MASAIEVEFTFDLDLDHPNPEVQSCQVMVKDDLPLHRDMMKRLRITARALREVFAEARELTKDIKPGDRIRIVADRAWRGKGRSYRGRTKDDFLVVPVRYSELSDPLMQGPTAGSC
jgi:hypothetical protein